MTENLVLSKQSFEINVVFFFKLKKTLLGSLETFLDKPQDAGNFSSSA